MLRFRTLAALSLGVAALAVGSSAYATAGHTKADVANGKKIFTEGKGSVPACTSCHMEDGMGNDMMGTPLLAGQIPQFIRKQLQDFAEDKRTDTTMFVMNTNAKGLSEQDRRDVAAYVSTLAKGKEASAKGASKLDELRGNGVEVGTPYLGKAIVNRGIPEKGVPACRSCHDYNGRGVDPMYPKIGEQKYVYLVNQLKKWRDASRSNDPMGQMRAVAKTLSDDEIHNVASFLTSASAYSMGNTRLPEEHHFMTFDVPKEGSE